MSKPCQWERPGTCQSIGVAFYCKLEEGHQPVALRLGHEFVPPPADREETAICICLQHPHTASGSTRTSRSVSPALGRAIRLRSPRTDGPPPSHSWLPPKAAATRAATSAHPRKCARWDCGRPRSEHRPPAVEAGGFGLHSLDRFEDALAVPAVGEGKPAPSWFMEQQREAWAILQRAHPPKERRFTKNTRGTVCGRCGRNFPCAERQQADIQIGLIDQRLAGAVR